MNTTNSTISVSLVISDYVFLGGQGFYILFTLVTMIGMFLMRNNNPIKSRGLLPYLSMMAFMAFVTRSTVSNLSIFEIKVQNNLTSNFSCYW